MGNLACRESCGDADVHVMACHSVDEGMHQSAKQVGESGTVRLTENQQFAIFAPTAIKFVFSSE